jgi:hypothetical protein
MSRYREKHNKPQQNTKTTNKKNKKDERQKALVFFIGQI